MQSIENSVTAAPQACAAPRHHRLLAVTFILIMMGALFTPATMADAAAKDWPGYCGAIGQRPCKVWEHVPSCKPTLVENFQEKRCTAKPQPKPLVKRPMDCGSVNQRPCKVWEYVPSCSEGLKEDFSRGICFHPTSEWMNRQNLPAGAGEPNGAEGGYEESVAPGFPEEAFPEWTPAPPDAGTGYPPAGPAPLQQSEAFQTGQAIGSVLGAAIVQAMTNNKTAGRNSESAIELCNRSDYENIRATIAYAVPGYADGSPDWVSKGRYSFKRRKCGTIPLPNSPDGRPYQYTVYVYAWSEDDGEQPRDWGGQAFGMCINHNAVFEYRHADKMSCDGEGMARVGAFALEAAAGVETRFEFRD